MVDNTLSASYAAAIALRQITFDILRSHARSATDIRIAQPPGPFRPLNWTIEWINVLAEDYGWARDKADEI